MSKYIVYLEQDGSFPDSHEKVYGLNSNDNLTIVLDSVELLDYTPLLLTNYPTFNNKRNTYHHPKAPEITAQTLKDMKKDELEKQYKVFTGHFTSEGSWQVDLHIQDFDGSLFMQIVFLKENYENKSSGNIQIVHFGKPEWIMIQPINTEDSSLLNIDELIIQTVLPYSLGHSSKWLEILKNQTQLGYNGFHFPPIQKLGYSGSYYSINDQMKSNLDFFTKDSFDEMAQIVKDLQKQTKAVCFIDILLNHTSFDSQWLLDNLDAVYNNFNTPCLNSAIELDEAIAQLESKLAKNELLEYYDGSNKVENEEQLNKLMEIMKEKVFYGLHLEQFYLFDKEGFLKKLEQSLKRHNITILQKEIDVDEDENIFARSGFDIINDYIQQYSTNIGVSRYGVNLDLEKLINEQIKQKPQQYCYEAFGRAIDFFNKQWEQKVKAYVEEAISSTYGQIRYWHITLQKPEVTKDYQLVPRYFTKLKDGVWAANNGWIQNYDPLKNFANDGEFHYLRRTICIWGDLVKLRYGNSKKDSPGLWKRMKQYVQQMASIFHGFRIDNSHSTPLHVGEYFMRKARNQNKNLMIFAELFTGNGSKDALYCKKMGINALVRETYHTKTSLDMFGQLSYISRITKCSVGSLDKLKVINLENGEKKEVLIPQMPKSIVYDQSHDNESILSQFSLQQTLSLTALLSFSPFIKGTVRGFDELYPEKLSVVSERRKYLSQLDCSEVHQKDLPIEVLITLKQNKQPESIEIRGDWDGWANGVQMVVFNQVDEGTWIYMAKFTVGQPNKLYEYKFNINGEWYLDHTKEIKNGNHFFQTSEKANQLIYSDNLCIARREFIKYNNILNQSYPLSFFSHQAHGFICVMRENQSTENQLFLISRTAYHEYDHKVDVEIECPGIIENIESIFWMNDSVEGHQSPNEKTQEYLQGLKTKVYQEFNILKYAEVKYCQTRKKSILHFFYAPPSLSIVIKCTLEQQQKQGIQNLNKILEEDNQKEACELYKDLSVNELNFLLFSAAAEEKERTGFGMYHISNQGDLLFAGLASIFHDIDVAMKYNDLGRNIFHNLREGYWYLDYIVNRLVKQGENLTKVANYFRQYFDQLKCIPKYLIPNYFCKFISNFKNHINLTIQKKMSMHSVKLNSTFHTNLLLANYQFLADLPSARFDNYTLSMAAGLPHFTTGWTRSWGRDTFIAFRGSLLIPGLYEEAKQIICMFGSTLRHGLIPNLLDSGRNSRYNCRDGCWWWVKAVKDYVEMTKDTNFLKKEINMQYLSDDSQEHQKLKNEQKSKRMTIQDIVQEIFQKHASGIKFREWKAGWELDSNMETEGFNISLKLEESNGFIVGGNIKNCLTWMDKMGSSVKAGNKGVPGTSRDGAPVEMTALLKCCLNFVNNCKEYPYKEVSLQHGKKLSFVQWSDLIQKNFEKCYWVPEGDCENAQLERYILRKGIYKDLYLSHNLRCDHLLRPNACIAISVAPELFDLKNAALYIDNVERNLIEQSSIGVKTLDPSAPEYVPYYDNADDGVQPKTAHGFSYHNGPEWVWIYGYFVKAILEVRKHQKGFNKEKLMSHLSNHKKFIQNNPWLSLPELTNQNGNFCHFSCPSQAWSIATLVEVCFDADQLKN